jgi:hypothetical protein
LKKISPSTIDEFKLRERLENDFTGRLLEDKYRRLEIPDDLRKLVTDQLREDTVVFLNSPSLSPLNLRASILNRFLVFLLREYGGLRYRAGEIEMVPTVAGQPFRVRFRHLDFPTEELEVDDVVVRHGPIPVIDRMFPRYVAEDCRPGSTNYDDLTRHPQYPSTFLASKRVLDGKRKVQLNYAIATSPLAARERFDPTEFDRFGIEVHGDEQQLHYVLRPRRANDPSEFRPDLSFYEIPFVYDRPIGPPLSRPKRIRSSDVYLSLGDGIQNIGQQGVRPPYPVATLGCFVHLKSTQKRALLTTVNVLGRPGEKWLGDRLVRADEKDPLTAPVIAAITEAQWPMPSSPRSNLAAANFVSNEFEGAVAVLYPDVQIQSKFGRA